VPDQVIIQLLLSLNGIAKQSLKAAPGTKVHLNVKIPILLPGSVHTHHIPMPWQLNDSLNFV
jgi:hypothetical protein